jgi:hypothetical protein
VGEMRVGVVLNVSLGRKIINIENISNGLDRIRILVVEIEAESTNLMQLNYTHLQIILKKRRWITQTYS